MKLTRRILLLVPLLCVLLPSAARTEQPKKSSLSFTLETKEKSVEFFQPLAIRVTLRNHSQSAISLDTRTLRIIAKEWHVVGTWGQWMEGEGETLEPEGRPAGRIELQAGASLNLLTVDEYPTFELLGPTRVGYRLSSTDTATKRLLPTNIHELRFHIPPTRLMSAVWAAQTQTECEQTQPAFNEFLKSWAAVEAEDKSKKEDFQKEMAEHDRAMQTLYFLAGYALPFLRDATRDKDPFIREQAVLAYPYAAGALDEFDAYLDALDALGPRPQWALNLEKNHNEAQADWRAFAMRALSDPSPEVRTAGVTVLTKKYWSESEQHLHSTSIGTPKNNPEQQSDTRRDTSRELEAVKMRSKDPDAGVRAAVQKYLSSFADKNEAADTVADALTDPDLAVRKKALDALSRSPEPPPLETLKRAFNLVKGETAVGLIPLLLEQEDSTLAGTFSKDFVRRSEAEHLAIMTAIAGHTDAEALDLIKSGLSDPSAAIQRAAMLRLLAFSGDVSTPLIENYLRRAPADLKPLAEAVKTEVQTRSLWPFLRTATNNQTAASEAEFPSRNGTMPVTSPDGQWIAYVETGWGRPGGSGGFGRSNLISITHVVDINGRNDQVVSDMFLVSWMSDSNRVGSARDAFVAISNLTGNVLAEFGAPLEARYRGSHPAGFDWTTSDLRSQFGGRMPHEKRLENTEDFGFGEGGSFSPDGKWYGPLQDPKGFFFLGADGQRLSIKQPLPDRSLGARWSPDGRYVQINDSNEWFVIDIQTLSVHKIGDIDDSHLGGACGSVRCRWDPWSKDGQRLTFLRDGQVWVSDAFGNGAKQLTFDSARKAFPTFSRDGRSVAYRTWQPDNRRHFVRLGPSDVWVVDVASTLATRVTASSSARVHNFDWLDDQSLIIDRVEKDKDSFVPRSSLRRISLTTAAKN